jgi:hypothetical protein
MKNSLSTILRPLIICLFALGNAPAAEILAVDFGAAANPVQAGFVGQSAASTTHSTTAGNVTVVIAGHQGIQNITSLPITVEGYNMYNDCAFKNGGNMTLTLSGPGISANTAYQMTFWSCYYNIQTRTTSFAATAGTTGTTLGPIATAITTPTGFNDPAYSATGTFTSDGSGVLTFSITGIGTGSTSRPMINGFKIQTIGGADTTPPTLASGDIVDDQGGGSVTMNSLVTYTLTFSEDIDAASVSSADFSNAGSSPISFGNITEATPGVFTVEVTPTAAGTLQLQIPIGATIMDMAGLSMATNSATIDDTTISVVVAPPDTTKPTPNPMSFAVVPYANSETSISMVATAASDAAGVEYLFTETSGNPGGDSSGWQGSPTYVDNGLTTGLVYTYTVTARDLSSNQNATAPSGPASATAETPVIPPVITAPTSRHIVQRTSSNVGTIKIEGTYSVGSPDEIEARAVVMTGTEDNGTTTAWQTIDAAPAGGTFAGSLTNVPAGGWYQLEVRTVINSTPSNAVVLAKVGVGDIYITAGQSNSANFAAGYTLQSDRVSARSSTTNSTWVLGTPPLPISNGTSGSVWPVLGDKLIAAEDVPIGFVSCGIGGSTASSWTIGGGNYNSLLKPAVKSFPVNGFKAALWHQGETDSVNGVPAATHSGYLNGMISQSRIDAGWSIPWYLAEVSFHPSSNITNQEPIAAGQRASIHGDALTFFGPSTDEFHLTGGGSLHFNAVGNEAHAQGWADILTGNVTAAPENGNFEDLGWLAYAVPPTSLTPLADGSATILNIVSGGQQIRVLDWRILAASGVAAADGSNGFHNPTTGTYAGAVDSVNGGVLPNMSGKHVALLDGGSAGNYFLQSTRSHATANTTYTLTVALGVRDNPASFGNARLEITANGAVVASASFDKAALDTLHGSDASGTFTNASVSWTTGGSVAANQPLAIRIVKEGGTGTVLDFDNVRLTSVPSNTYSSWIDGYGLDPADKDFNDDPDGDGLANGLEAWFGTHPGQFNAGLADFATNGTTTTFTHPRNANPPTDVTGNFYDWCVNLADWYPSGGGPGGGPTVTLVPVTVGTTTTVTATASEPIPTFFLRARATRN